MIHLFEMFYFADLQQHTQGFNYTNQQRKHVPPPKKNHGQYLPTLQEIIGKVLYRKCPFPLQKRTNSTRYIPGNQKIILGWLMIVSFVFCLTLARYFSKCIMYLSKYPNNNHAAYFVFAFFFLYFFMQHTHFFVWELKGNGKNTIFHFIKIRSFLSNKLKTAEQKHFKIGRWLGFLRNHFTAQFQRNI